MNKAVKTTLSVASALLATPVYFGVKNFRKNHDLSPLKKTYFSLLTTGIVSASSFLAGAFVINNLIAIHSQSRPPVCTESMNADYYSITSAQREFVTPIPLRESYFSFATPLAPLIQYAFGEFPTHETTTIVGILEHNSIKYDLSAKLNRHVPLSEIGADVLSNSNPSIKVRQPSSHDLLDKCGL